MQKFVEGPVQISTRQNTYNKIIAPSAFISGGSFNTEDIRQLWGNLWSPNPLPNTSGMDDLTYQQSLDLYTKYQNRSLPLHSRFMTAAARNARNDFIITYATPVFQTAELNFHVTNTEWNQIEYDDLPEGGIANETTFVKWGWTDTSRKKKQELHFSVDLANDPNYGANTFIENFAQLASTCLLSLYKSTYYSIVHTAYQNKIYDRTNDIPFDISKLFLAEMEAFFAFAVDPDQGFNLIREELRALDGLDLVLLPEGGSRWVKEDGATQRQLRSRQLTYNTASEKFEAAVDQPGPMTYKSYQLGDNWLDFMETRSFQVNSLDPRLENPLSTKLTLCQFYPPNTDCKPGDDPVSTDPRILDMVMFYQTKEEGEDRRVSFKDSLRACGYWDPENDGEISQDVRNYIAQLNARGASTHNAPWQFHSSGPGRTSDVNVDSGDYENPSVDALNAIGNCTDYTRMHSVRDKFCGVLYDTVDGQYKQVDYVGSNHLDTLPNEWLLKAAKSLALKFYEKTGQSMANGLSALTALLDKLDRADVTQEWIQGVIDANMLAGATDKNGLPEFRANVYGGLNLPSSEVATRSGVIYPNGWQSGAGLLTLRDEGLKAGSPYGRAAQEAGAALDFVEYLIAFIRQYVGESDVVSPDLAAPWFQFDKGLSVQTGNDAERKKARYAAIAAFVDAVWKRGTPTFLGVPIEASSSEGGDVVADRGDQARLGASDNGTVALLNDLVATPLTRNVFANQPEDRRPVINDAVRALACLSMSVADTYRVQILTTSAAAAGFNDAMKAYYRYVIAQTNAGRQPAAKTTARGKSDVNRKIANAVTQEFFDLLYPSGADATDGSVERAKAMIDTASNPQADARAFDALKQKLMSLAAYKAEDDSLAGALQEYESVLASRYPATSRPQTAGDRQTQQANRDTAARGRNVAYFAGDYRFPEPDRYMRSPFMSSDKLYDFIARTGYKWAVPADANTLYTTADESVARYQRQGDIDFVERYDARVAFSAHDRLSASLNVLLNSDEMLMGAPSGVAQRAALEQLRFGASDSGAQRQVLLRQAYPGPIDARFRFYDTIENELQKIFFLVLVQAKNKLDTHLRLSEVGAQLINVLLFRPFIEFFACSIIVMRAGEESGAVPISRFDTYISKEDRGYFHIGCSYYSGFIRLNPKNFRMIPYCMPDRFVGGKKCDFMTKSDQWVPHNPLKPSIIALPTPVAERTYASPLHMMNGQSISRPDIDYPSFTNKYSSAGFYELRFSSDNVRHVDECHFERIKYKNVTYASHVAHRGWRAFYDPSTGYLKEFEGTGPGCSRSMNMPGAQYVWNGKNALFVKDHPTQYTRKRAM